MRRIARLLLIAIAGAVAAPAVMAQTPPIPPIREGNYNISARTAEDMALPNTYVLDEGFFQWPKGRPVGSISAIDMDRDGKSIWVFERCGKLNSCIGSTVNPIMKFDSNGRLVKEFGAGLFVYPHGMYVDHDNNVWVADLQSNVDRPAPPGGVRPPPAPAGTPLQGAVVRKFSPDGKLLLTIGTPGVMGNDETHLSQPSDVAVAKNGDVFVADGHDSQPSNHRIAKFDRDGRFLKAWDACGPMPADTLDCQHSIAIDSQGRLLVANRGNNRIEVFDQEGKLLDEWYQFGRPSGLFIDDNDVLYAADSESDVMQHNAFVRGVHVGSARTGDVTAFIPDPQGNPSPWMPAGTTNGAEGVAASKDGTIYVSKVLPAQLVRYGKKDAAPR
jgi:hypothetical protein